VPDIFENPERRPGELQPWEPVPASLSLHQPGSCNPVPPLLSNYMLSFTKCRSLVIIDCQQHSTEQTDSCTAATPPLSPQKTSTSQEVRIWCHTRVSARTASTSTRLCNSRRLRRKGVVGVKSRRTFSFGSFSFQRFMIDCAVEPSDLTGVIEERTGGLIRLRIKFRSS
jgi:hypothetical protein